MDDSTYAKIASIILIIHGCIELLSLSMFYLPPEFIPVTLSEDSTFWAIIGAMYGVARIVAGYGILKLKRGAIVFGMILSTVTLAVAPTIIPFGLMDLPLALIVLWCLMFLWFDAGSKGGVSQT